jgi:hypothetical protein
MRKPTDAWLYDQNITLIDASGIDNWVTVRDYDEFTLMIRNAGIPSTVSFDHDLHFEHMRHYFDVVSKCGIVEYGNLKHKTGLHCAQYLIGACAESKVPLPRCYVHSANEVGRDNIKKLLGLI